MPFSTNKHVNEKLHPLSSILLKMDIFFLFKKKKPNYQILRILWAYIQIM